MQHPVIVAALRSTNGVTKLAPATTAVLTLTALVLGGLVLPSSATHAQSRFELPSIVVTATRETEPLREVPKNITVISAEDIARTTSTDVAGLISREAGVNLQSFFGQEKNAVIDIRGFGQAAGSNVLILIDGVRLNAPDLSAPDLSAVALDQIERIEIIRGPGGVEYGDKAVGGVINIFTKAPPKTGSKDSGDVSVGATYGAYGAHGGHITARGAHGPTALSLSVSHRESDGYRVNAGLRKTDVRTRVTVRPSRWASIDGALSYHEDRAGLPGALPSATQSQSGARQGSNAPQDFAETIDKRADIGTTIQRGDWGTFKARAAFRERDNDFIIGFTPTLSEDAQKGHIDERSTTLDLSYSNSIDIGTLSQSVRAGWSYFTTDFSREVIGQRSRRLSDLATRAMFVSFDLRPLKQLGFRVGYRHERTWLTRQNDTLTDFFGPAPLFVPLGARFVSGPPIETVWRNDAMELGAVFEVSAETHLFANYERTFRTPNVDELALATANLRPQHGEHIDLGFRTVVGDAAELSATLFKTRIQDEIFFGRDPTTGMQVNRNFDDGTKRRGIELDVKWYPHEKLYVWANYTQLIARFNTRDTTVPLVPHRMFNLGAELDLTTHLLAAVAVRWVGSRFDGNDENNTAFPELPSYRIFDAKLRYQRDKWTLSAGVNNVFNELYSTLAFSRTVYPMPERNAYVSAAITF